MATGRDRRGMGSPVGGLGESLRKVKGDVTSSGSPQLGLTFVEHMLQARFGALYTLSQKPSHHHLK